MSSIFIYYKIVSKNENIKDCYVGKTKNFKKRVLDHKSSCNNKNSKEYNFKLYKYIRENQGIDNWEFIEIETNEYDNKDSAFRERYWIEELKATLNSDIPTRTDKEYYENNKKIINEKSKEYYEKNAEIIKNKVKNYYEKNKDKINEKNKEKITCECGCEIVKNHLSRHMKTQKHLNYLSNTK
jgi:hypothetical protein